MSYLRTLSPCPVIRFSPMKCSTERLQHLASFAHFARGLVYPIFSSLRQDAKTAKTAKKNIFLFIRTWRPLWFDCAHYPESIEGRLCNSPRGISFPQKRYLFIHGIIPRGKSSFIRFPKPKFNGKFQICLVSPFRTRYNKSRA